MGSIAIEEIYQPGNYGNLTITGPDQYSLIYDHGLFIDTDNGVVELDEVRIENINIGLWKKGNGQVNIKKLLISKFGGDAINIRGSNITIEELVIRDERPVKTYYNLIVSETVLYGAGKLEYVLNQINEPIYNLDQQPVFNMGNGEFKLPGGGHLDMVQVYNKSCHTTVPYSAALTRQSSKNEYFIECNRSPAPFA